MAGVRTHPRIADALRDGRPVVALESAVITCGLPRAPLEGDPPADAAGWNADAPVNLEAARLMQRAVHDAGALDALIAVLEGTLHVGLDDEQLERLARDPHAAKAGAGDLAAALASGATAGTTVSGTLVACRLASPAPIRVFATGGIGGVHRGWTDRPDISADLLELARTPACVVCSGAKSILDLPATLEALESLAVPVVGFRTRHFPRFFSTGTPDLTVHQCAQTVDEAASICRHHLETLSMPGGLVLAQPVPAASALPEAEIDPLLEEAELDAAASGATGAARTPHLLDFLARRTAGRTLRANIALLQSNARLAGQLAAALVPETGA